MMFINAFSALLLAALSVRLDASPVSRETFVLKRNNDIDDTTVLNFALTLELIETAFYAGALDKFDEQAFSDAGLEPWVRPRFVQIGEHEKTHAEFLQSVLGDNATQACEYSFPYTDPKSFAALSQIIEGVGTSAYTGAAHLLSNKDYLTASASILATEARQAAWLASAVNKISPWSGSFDVPLTLNEAFSLAAPFIVPGSCPQSNPTLPVEQLPTLTLTGNAVPGGEVCVTLGDGAEGATYVVFLTGLDQDFVEIQDGSDGKKVTIPDGLVGQVYAVATNSSTDASDVSIVAGPALLLFEQDSDGNLVD